jgi:hypothetical protein
MDPPNHKDIPRLLVSSAAVHDDTNRFVTEAHARAVEASKQVHHALVTPGRGTARRHDDQAEWSRGNGSCNSTLKGCVQRVAFTITESVNDHSTHANGPGAQHRLGRCTSNREESCRSGALPSAPFRFRFTEVNLPFNKIAEQLSATAHAMRRTPCREEADRCRDRGGAGGSCDRRGEASTSHLMRRRECIAKDDRRTRDPAMKRELSLLRSACEEYLLLFTRPEWERIDFAVRQCHFAARCAHEQFVPFLARNADEIATWQKQVACER